MAFAFSCAVSLSSYGQNVSDLACQLLESGQNQNRPQALTLLLTLAKISEAELEAQLRSPSVAKAFWLNIYNALVQNALTENPQLFLDRTTFFEEKSFVIAGRALSLDDIEHGILRRSTHKYSFGYIGSFFVPAFEKKFRVSETDYRIHFALNCGAKSCPPVARYDSNRLDEQLDLATRHYLTETCRLDSATNTVWIPALCSWYRGDFGGEEGLREMLRKFAIIEPHQHPDLEYLPYDWTLHLKQFVTL